MPSPPKPRVARAAEPAYGQSFDPWNSSSSGHQCAENRLGASTGWRDSRNRKLTSQFAGGAGGGKRVSDTVGAGAQDWDPRAKALITPEVRSRARSSVLDMLAKPGTMRSATNSTPSSAALPSATTATTTTTTTSDSSRSLPRRKETSRSSSSSGGGGAGQDLTTEEERLMAHRKAEDETRKEEEEQQQAKKRRRGLFDGVVVYVNGSTYPLISDHKLKHVLAEHGGKMSSHLGRRHVTHVILGRPVGSGHGSGGGLAGGKLQREIAKAGGAAVRYVGVEWVLESIKAGKRQPEARFAELKIAAKGQQSVYGLYTGNKEKVNTPANVDASQPPPSAQAREEEEEDD
ncbi:BRCA1 C terminus domain-containing protein [Xylariaceae sp. FL1651]|nr:BRCA1 C terminus domain-containing protein [Xylariaceae sp. FL1651]